MRSFTNTKFYKEWFIVLFRERRDFQMTFEKAFDSIKKKFADADAKNVSDFAIQVTMSDEDCGGTFYIEAKGGVLSVEPYDYKDNNAVLDITKSDLTALIGGKKSINKVVENGATLKGDVEVIGMLTSMLKKPAKKTAAKKPAAKKTAAKAPAKKAPAKKTASKTTAAKKAAPKAAAKAAAPATTTASKTATATAEKKTTK